MLKNLVSINKKQNKVYRRLLLLTRCLVIILLSFLFAQPYIKNQENKLKGDESNAVVVILDNSFSMQNSSAKGSNLEYAKSKAEEILKEYSDNDVFCLLTTDMQGKHRHFVGKKYFMEFLKETEISSVCIPYSKLINTAHHLLQMRNEKNKRVFFISDFQTTQTDLENIKQDSTIKDVFLPIIANNTNNIYVDSILFDRNIYQKGQKIDIKIFINNASDKKAENIPVKLFIDNVQQSMANITLAEHSTELLNMSFVIKQSGMLKGRVHVLDSPIIYDDDFYFSLNIEDKIKILVINDGKENVYINRLFEQSQEIELHNVEANTIDFSKFGLYNVIILSELQNISSGLAQELNNFKSGGGSIVIIPPSKMNISVFNEGLRSLNMPKIISLEKRNVSVNGLDVKNSLYKSVFSSITENMPLPKVSQYYRIANNVGIAKQDIMILANGDAFLSESNDKNGKSFLFAVPFSEDFSDFCLQSIFVPTLWNMVLYSEKRIEPFLFTNDNSFVDISVFADSIDSEIINMVSEDSSFSVIPQLQRIDNKLCFRVNGQIKQAGVYFIKDGEKNLGTIAFNYPREESKLIFNTPSLLNKIIKQNNFKNIEIFDGKKMISTYFAQSNKKFDFTLLIVAMLSLCIICEIFLIRKMKNN